MKTEVFLNCQAVNNKELRLQESLVVNPRLILLDELFSNLDENLKENMRQEIKRLVNYFE